MSHVSFRVASVRLICSDSGPGNSCQGGVLERILVFLPFFQFQPSQVSSWLKEDLSFALQDDNGLTREREELLGENDGI